MKDRSALGQNEIPAGIHWREFLYLFSRRTTPYFDIVVPNIEACDQRIFTGFTVDAVVAEVMVHPYRLKSPGEIAKGNGLFAPQNSFTVLSHDTVVIPSVQRVLTHPMDKETYGSVNLLVLWHGCSILLRTRMCPWNRVNSGVPSLISLVK